MTVRTRLLAMLALCAVCGTLLGGCGGASTPPASTPESPLGTPESPAFTSPISPQPTPVTLVLPTPSSPELATVGGVLVRDADGGDSGPLVEGQVLLAEVLRSEDGAPLMAAAGDETSPSATTDENGHFVFTDVVPNTYGLVIDTPFGSFLLKDETGGDLLFDVQAGEVLDTGEVHTDLPY